MYLPLYALQGIKYILLTFSYRFKVNQAISIAGIGVHKIAGPSVYSGNVIKLADDAGYTLGTGNEKIEVKNCASIDQYKFRKAIPLSANADYRVSVVSKVILIY